MMENGMASENRDARKVKTANLSSVIGIFGLKK